MTQAEVLAYQTCIKSRYDEFFVGTERTLTTENSDRIPSPIYTESVAYLDTLFGMHREKALQDCLAVISDRILFKERIVDVGCAAGLTGLPFALAGYHVTFHDYEGLGLRFLRHFIAEQQLAAVVVPYGEPIEQHDWALAVDVIEHTGDQLACLKWLESLGKKILLTYPLTIEYQPPYLVSRVDEWVDDLGIVSLVDYRYKVFLCVKCEQRRYLGYKVGTSSELHEKACLGSFPVVNPANLAMIEPSVLTK